jgi:hypothetical protein
MDRRTPPKLPAKERPFLPGLERPGRNGPTLGNSFPYSLLIASSLAGNHPWQTPTGSSLHNLPLLLCQTLGVVRAVILRCAQNPRPTT